MKEPTAPLDEEEKGAPSHQKSSPHRPEDTDCGWERVSGVSPHRSASNHDHWLSDRRDFGGRREVDVIANSNRSGGTALDWANRQRLAVRGHHPDAEAES